MKKGIKENESQLKQIKRKRKKRPLNQTQISLILK